MDMQEDLHERPVVAKETDSGPTGLSFRTQVKLLLGFLLAVAALTVFGVASLRGFVRPPAEENATNEPAAASGGRSIILTDRQWNAVKIATVERGVFQNSAETDGKIAVDDDQVTPVFSPYTGRVTKLYARAGDTVRIGDPLLAIQASELAQAQNDIITAVSNLRTAMAQLQLSQTNEKRQHDLYLSKGAALKDWQQAQVDLATAQGGLNSDSIALAAVRNRLRALGKSDKDITDVETTSDLLRIGSNTVVPAPIGGTIVQRQVGLGQNIISASSGAQNPLFMISDLSKVWLVANVRETDVPQLHIGDTVQVRVLAYPKKVFDARLTYVSASMDPVTHRLLVRAEVANPKRELLPEMFGTFRIVTGEDINAPAVPCEAVVFDGGTAHVWVADAAKKSLEFHSIETGRNRDGQFEVLSGLQAGEQIVTAGAVFIDRAASGD